MDASTSEFAGIGLGVARPAMPRGAGAAGTMSWHVLVSGGRTDAFALGVDAVLATALAVYAAGAVRSRRRSDVAGPLPWWRVACFFAGAAGVFVALGSDLAAYQTVDPSALVVQHVLLMMGAPPLLVLGRPTAALRSLGVSGACRSHPPDKPKRGLTGALCWPLYYGAMAVYFLTPLCAASVRHRPLLEVIELAFVAVGCLFWAGLAGSGRSHAFRIGAVLVGMPVETAIGIALILWPRSLVPGQDLSATHAAGLTLWLASMVASAAALGAVLGAWVIDDTKRASELDVLLVSGLHDTDGGSAALTQ